MKRNVHVLLLVGAALVVSGAAALAGGKAKPVTSVTYAKTWDAAVEEAKLLNLPIIVHNHGFNCAPCWGMHSSVLMSKEYIQFAEKNTVEVIALSSLQGGIDAGDPRAATYEAKGPAGDKVEYMVEFPGLTAADMLALDGSPASNFNKSGKIPYTAIVDPFTLAELKSFVGSTSSKTLMEEIGKARKTLASHGSGIARSDYRAVVDGGEQVAQHLGAGDFKKAVDVTEALRRKNLENQMLKDMIADMDKVIVESATHRLEELRTQSTTDAATAKRELRKLATDLRGTEVGEKAQALLESIG